MGQEEMYFLEGFLILSVIDCMNTQALNHMTAKNNLALRMIS